MATKREVELIIRARDQAKSAVEGIINSLQQLSEEQTRLSKTGATANTALGRLATELATLQKNAQGLTALGRLASNLDRTTNNVDRMEKSLAQAEVRLKATQVAASGSALKLAELESAARQAGVALSREQQALASSRAEQVRLNEAVGQAKERYQQLLNAVRSQTSASETLKNSVRSQRDTLVSLLEAQTRQNQAVIAQQQAVRVAGQAFSTLAQQVKTASSEFNRANVAFEKAATGARDEASAVDEAKTALGEIRNVAGSAAQALGGVETKQEAIRTESARVAAAIQKVTDALLRQQQAQAKALAQGGQGGIQTQSNAFRAQEQAVQQARQAFKAASVDLKTMRDALSAAVEPTAVLRAELEAARINAQAAGQEWRTQSTILTQLGQQLKAAALAEREKAAADAEARQDATAAAFALDQQALAERRAALAAQLLGRNVKDMTGALGGVAGAANQAGQGVQRFGDQSRRALSLVQRVRGEVLSLATSFFGLFAAIQGVGGVIQSLRAVEAAASRLNVVFEGDQTKAREQLRFLSQEADRLGLSFSVLAQEFGRFAIATDAANFSIEATNKIFIAVAEASRVNKVSVEELEGTFLALQQMVSKGTVSMEELRRQLGDRLPGAFNIFADALGVSTAELDRMIRAGEVQASQSNLLKFADELTKRFGGALPAALETVTTQIDRFQNNVFEAQNRIAQGGFADALEESLRKLNETFRSREGRDFFLQIGALLGNFVKVLSFVTDNFELLLNVFKAFVAIKVGGFIANLNAGLRASAASAQIATAQFLALDGAQQKQVISMAASASASGALTASLRILFTQLTATAVAVVRTGVASATTATAFRGLTAAAGAVVISLRAILVALGPLALAAGAVFALTQMFGDFATTVPDATRALDEHNRQLDIYEKEANEAERAGRAFNAALVETTAFEARGNLEDLANAYAGARKESTEAARKIIEDWKRQNQVFKDNQAVKEVERLTDQLKNGKISVRDYQEGLKKLANEVEGPIARSLTGLLAQLSGTQDGLRETEVAMGKQALIVQQLGGDLGNLSSFYQAVGVEIDSTTGKIRLLTDALDEQRAKAAEAAKGLETVESFIPRIERERENASRRQKLSDAGTAALSDPGLSEAERTRRIALIEEAKRELEKLIASEEEKANKTPRKKRDEQREFNEELQRTVELREFEATLVGKTAKQQEIEKAIFETRQQAQEKGVKFTEEQEKALRDATAAVFDAEEAERVRLLTLEQTEKLRDAMHDKLSVQERIELEAKQQNIDLLTEEGKAWADVTRQILERSDATEELKRQVDEVIALEKQRQDAIKEFEAARAAGELNTEAQEAEKTRIEEMRINIEKARLEAVELAKALGDEEAIARLTRVNSELSRQEQLARQIATQVNEMFAGGLTDAIANVGAEIGKAIDGTQKWGDALGNIRDTFLQFAADFLIQIAKMIIQALILKAIQSSGIGGQIGGFIAGIQAHTGGVVGRSAQRRRNISGALLSNAARFHDGGLPGLKQGEVGAVLKKGEEVLTENDPRHVKNGGGQSGPIGVRIINAIDPAEFMEKGMNSPQGQQTFMNFIRANKTAISGALQ